MKTTKSQAKEILSQAEFYYNELVYLMPNVELEAKQANNFAIMSNILIDHVSELSLNKSASEVLEKAIRTAKYTLELAKSKFGFKH